MDFEDRKKKLEKLLLLDEITQEEYEAKIKELNKEKDQEFELKKNKDNRKKWILIIVGGYFAINIIVSIILAIIMYSQTK